MDTGQDTFEDRITLLQSCIDKKISTALELLVTVSGLLQPNDYMQLAPILWYQHLDNTASHVIAPVCFRRSLCDTDTLINMS